MPPGQQINPEDLSYKIAKKVCSAADMERLACAFLNATGKVDYDAEKAAREYGPGAKGDSFKRGIWVICKKIKEAKAEANGGEEEEGDADVATPKKGTKRKAETNGDDDVATKKKGRGAGGKKKKNEAVKEEPVEQSGEESDGLL